MFLEKMQNESRNISEITDKHLWDDFVTSQKDHTFLHSWAWGEFNEASGDKIWRLGIYPPPYQGGGRGGNLLAVALVIKVHAKRGNFLFIPHGPVGDRKALPLLVEKIKEFARQERVSFVRMSPLLADTPENRELFKELGFRPAPIHVHAETTWTLNLAPREDDLLYGMRKTTRNLIRRAMKEGVEVRIGTEDKDVKIFNVLYQETVSKHHFTPFSLTFLQKQVKVLPDTHVFTAYHQGQPLASAIIVFYGNSAFYHHGASIASKIPAAYLLQWEAIREAKRRGHKFYNFWGIVPQATSDKRQGARGNHPWAGLSLFKIGFGGFETNYLHAQDLPLSWIYWANYILETLRRIHRRL